MNRRDLLAAETIMAELAAIADRVERGELAGDDGNRQSDALCLRLSEDLAAARRTRQRLRYLATLFGAVVLAGLAWFAWLRA